MSDPVLRPGDRIISTPAKARCLLCKTPIVDAECVMMNGIKSKRRHVGCLPKQKYRRTYETAEANEEELRKRLAKEEAFNRGRVIRNPGGL